MNPLVTMRFMMVNSTLCFMLKHCTALLPSIAKPLPSMTTPVRALIDTVLVSKMSAPSSILALIAKATVS